MPSVVQRSGLTSVLLAVPLMCLSTDALALIPSDWNITVEPSAEVSEVLSDNSQLQAGQRSSDAITRLTGRVAVRAKASTLQGFADYSLTQLLYARQSSDNTLQQGLNAAFQGALFDDRRLSYNAGATISRAALSAFGAGVGPAELVNSNSTETRSLRLGLGLRGSLAGVVSYTGRVNWSRSNAAGNVGSDSAARGAGLQLALQRAGPFGVSLDLGRDVSSFSLGRSSTADRLTLNGSYELTSLDLQLRARGGVERTDLLGGAFRTSRNWSAGAAWTPSPRTSLSVDYGERFFGRNYALQVSYRTPLTVWQASASRGLNTGNGLGVAGNRSTYYELLFAQYAALEPDPAKRDVLVLALLQQANVDPNGQARFDYLVSSATVTDSLTLSTAWRHARESVLLQYTLAKNRRADTASVAIDDLSTSSEVRSATLFLNLGHKLTPDSNVSLSGFIRGADGTQAGQRSRQRQVSLQYGHVLGRHVNASVGFRRAIYDVQPANYAESALTLTLSARF